VHLAGGIIRKGVVQTLSPIAPRTCSKAHGYIWYQVLIGLIIIHMGLHATSQDWHKHDMTPLQNIVWVPEVRIRMECTQV